MARVKIEDTPLSITGLTGDCDIIHCWSLALRDGLWYNTIVKPAETTNDFFLTKRCSVLGGSTIDCKPVGVDICPEQAIWIAPKVRPLRRTWSCCLRSQYLPCIFWQESDKCVDQLIQKNAEQSPTLRALTVAPLDARAIEMWDRRHECVICTAMCTMSVIENS